VQQVDDFKVVGKLFVELAAGNERQEDVVGGVRFLVVYSSCLAFFFEQDSFKSLVSKMWRAEPDHFGREVLSNLKTKVSIGFENNSKL
jgi:hypothetical protein